MSNSINRRGFLKSSFLGLSAFAVGVLPLKSFAKSNATSNHPLTSADALVLCQQARELFYRKQYSAAAAIYEQLIAAFPARIEYYDAYAKVFGAQQKLLEIAELYRNGHTANPENPYFKHRLSLSLRRLATGNRKHAAEYQNRYGTVDLWQQSAELLIAAIAIKQANDFKLDLRDLPAAVEKQNRLNEKHGFPAITLPAGILNNINALIVSVLDKWTETRTSRSESFTEAGIDGSVEKLKNKDRRNLHNNKELKEREKSTKKALKKRYKFGLDDAIARDIPGQVDKYGLKIVSEITGDTNTIGRLRRYYHRKNFGNRLITLNRLLYVQNDNTANTLALASALVRYGNGNPVIQECKQLADSVSEYVKNLPALYAANYYILRSQIAIKENKPVDARNALLVGIEHFNGAKGISYTLMEHYAMTYLNKDAANGVKIMKALCNKGLDNDIDNAVRQYVETYCNNINFGTLSTGEQIKHLYALAKLQKKQGGNYKATEAEIAALKNINV